MKHHKRLPRRTLALIVVAVLLIMAIGMWSFRTWDAGTKIEELQTNTFTVKLLGSTSWDNYCFPKEIVFESSQHKKLNTIAIKDSLGTHCGTGSKWLKAADLNGDGYLDVLLYRDTMNPRLGDDSNVYKKFIFDPVTDSFKSE